MESASVGVLEEAGTRGRRKGRAVSFWTIALMSVVAKRSSLVVANMLTEEGNLMEWSKLTVEAESIENGKKASW